MQHRPWQATRCHAPAGSSSVPRSYLNRVSRPSCCPLRRRGESAAPSFPLVIASTPTPVLKAFFQPGPDLPVVAPQDRHLRASSPTYRDVCQGVCLPAAERDCLLVVHRHPTKVWRISRPEPTGSGSPSGARVHIDQSHLNGGEEGFSGNRSSS